VVHASGPLLRRGEVALDGDVQLGAGPARPHLVDVHGVPRLLRMRILAHRAHAQPFSQERIDSLELRHAEQDGAEPAKLVLGGDRAAVPWMRLPSPAVVDEGEPLSLPILEVEGEPAVALDDVAVRDAVLVEVAAPELERGEAVDAEVRARDRPRPPTLPRNGPVEEREIRPRRPLRIRVEQVVGADVVLVDRPPDEAHPERPRVEAVVLPDPRRDRGQVMNALEIHVRAHPSSVVVCRARTPSRRLPDQYLDFKISSRR
jgi:hypothetical protein